MLTTGSVLLTLWFSITPFTPGPGPFDGVQMNDVQDVAMYIWYSNDDTVAELGCFYVAGQILGDGDPVEYLQSACETIDPGETAQVIFRYPSDDEVTISMAACGPPPPPGNETPCPFTIERNRNCQDEPNDCEVPDPPK